MSDFDNQIRGMIDDGAVAQMDRRKVEKACKALRKMENDELANLREMYKIGQ